MQTALRDGAPADTARARAPRATPRQTTTELGLIVALVLTYVCTHLLLLSRFPWFIDETYFASFAQAVEGDRTKRFIALSDHKGLVNTWIAAAFIKLGVAPVEAMRLLSMLAGLVAAAATGWIVARWRGRRDGLIAGALTLFVPWLFVHGAIGVYDEFIVAGSMVALALQLSLARDARLDRSLLLGFTFGLLLLSKPTGALAIALVPVSLVVFDWKADAVLPRLLRWSGAQALAVVIGLAMYALTRLSPLDDTPPPPNHRTLSDFFADPFGSLGDAGAGVLSGLVGYMTLAILVVALWGAWRAIATRDRTGIVLIVWALAPLAAWLMLTVQPYPRYGLQMAPPLCALAVVGGVDLWKRLERRWSARVAWAVTALALVQLVVLDAWVVIDPQRAPYPGLDHDQYVVLTSNTQPDREAAELIVERAPKRYTPLDPGREHTVAMLAPWPITASLVLNGDKVTAYPRFKMIRNDATPDALAEARFVVTELPPGVVPPGIELTPDQVVRTWQRPGGPSTTLYDRGS